MERLLHKRVSSAGRTQYLVKWQGYDASAATWEPEEELLDGAPERVAEYEQCQSAATVTKPGSPSRETECASATTPAPLESVEDVADSEDEDTAEGEEGDGDAEVREDEEEDADSEPVPAADAAAAASASATYLGLECKSGSAIDLATLRHEAKVVMGFPQPSGVVFKFGVNAQGEEWFEYSGFRGHQHKQLLYHNQNGSQWMQAHDGVCYYQRHRGRGQHMYTHTNSTRRNLNTARLAHGSCLAPSCEPLFVHAQVPFA